MSPKEEKPASDRRRHQRFPVVEGMIEPITINFDNGKDAPEDRRPASGPRNQPALLVDISAGGMSLLLFMEPPRSKKLEMVINLPGLSDVPVEGRIVRINEKGATFSVGIAFSKISKKHQEKINMMAQDNIDCETRIELKLPEACVPTCTFNALCAKAQKAPYWPAAK